MLLQQQQSYINTRYLHLCYSLLNQSAELVESNFCVFGFRGRQISPFKHVALLNKRRKLTLIIFKDIVSVSAT